MLLKNSFPYGITPQFLHPLNAEVILDEFPKSTKRTKTIATIGYSGSDSGQTQRSLRQLASSSMRA